MDATTAVNQQLAAALDRVYQIPDSPHTSVIQRAVNDRTAFRFGWQEHAATVPAAIGNAFVTLESTEGRYSIVMKFNQSADAFAVHSYLLGVGSKECNGAPAAPERAKKG